jgi:hypothetical protein
MEFLDEIPEEEKQTEVTQKVKRKTIKTELPEDGYGLEIGSLTFFMGDVELEIKDVKVRDMDDFRKMIFEVLEQ